MAQNSEIEGYIAGARKIWEDNQMWPLSPEIFRGIPLEILPSLEELTNARLPSELLDLLLLKLSQKLQEPRMDGDVGINQPQHVIIEGPVWLDQRVRITGFTKLSGPVYVGSGSIVGDYSNARDAIFSQDNVIGFGSEVARSVLGTGCTLHRAYVGDSILCRYVKFGGQAQTANVRADGKEIKTIVNQEKRRTGRNKLGAMIGEKTFLGASCTTMPGIKIGSGCVVGPNVVLNVDLPDNRRVFVSQNLEFS